MESPFIEELKKAGEEVKKAEKTSIPEIEKPTNPLIVNPVRDFKRNGVGIALESKISNGVKEKEKTGFEELRIEKEIIPLDWQKEIKAEREKLEIAYKEVEEFRKRIQQRLEMVKRLEHDLDRVSKGLSHFSQIKKENEILLDQTKNQLRKGNG